MPLTHFYCPDDGRITVKQCLSKGGCRMAARCATVPFLRKISFDRKFTGISPSAAGNGPRYIWLKATTDYCTSPNERVFAVLGTTVHNRLGDKGIIVDVLSEESLSDEQMKGIADILEDDEMIDGKYILSDYKTSGSFAVAKWLGLTIKKTDEPVLDDKGEPIRYKSGKRKGEVKTKQKKEMVYVNPEAGKRPVTLQLNRYRIFYERAGFPVSKLQVMAIPRDGNTFIAKNRGIDKNMYIIPITRMPDHEVLDYYEKLQHEVNMAFEEEYARLCEPWEHWSGNRCNGYCEVAEECQDICLEFKEKWPGKR